VRFVSAREAVRSTQNRLAADGQPDSRNLGLRAHAGAAILDFGHVQTVQPLEREVLHRETGHGRADDDGLAEGGVVEALRTGAITAAGLDVLETEPQIPQELVALDNVLITPHVAWYSEEAEEEDRRRTAEEIIRVVVHGEPPRNPVP